MAVTTGDVDYRLLGFELEGEQYCVDISLVSEVVKRPEGITRIPRTPPHVEGLIDLRGSTTTVVNPKTALGVVETTTGNRILVLSTDDSEHRVGWIVDAADEVFDVHADEVDNSVESESINGVIPRDEGFLIWVDPERIGV